MPVAKVEALAAALAERMEATGHPFILGTECDTLHVEGCGDTIRAKIARAFTIQVGRSLRLSRESSSAQPEASPCP